MDIVIRKFHRADVIKAGNVIKRAQRITLKGLYPPEIIEAFCKRNNPKSFLERAREREFFVAEIPEKDRIIGVIAIKDDELKTFYVDPDYQKRGVGRLLYERFAREAGKRGYKTVKVYSSLYAEPIYRALGFKKIRNIRKECDGFSYEDILMKKEL